MATERADLVCIGGANVDRKLRLLGPLQMATSNPATGLREAPGGVARNVAENLARLGLPTRLICAVGDDASGRGLLAGAAALGLSTTGSALVAGALTDSYTAVLDDSGAMLLGLAAMPLVDRLTPAFLRSAIRPSRLTLIDLNLPADSVAWLIQHASSSGEMLVAVAVSEPKLARLPLALSGLHALILNEGELRAAAPGMDTAAALAHLHQRGVRQVFVTCGAAGVMGSRADAPAQRLPPPPAPQVVDVTGAGDAFAAGVCAALLTDAADMARACRLGLKLAALTLQTAATVHPDISPELLTP